MKNTGRKRTVDGLSSQRKRTRTTRSFDDTQVSLKIPIVISSEREHQKKKNKKTAQAHTSSTQQIKPTESKKKLKTFNISWLIKILNHKITRFVFKIIIVGIGIVLFFNNRDQTIINIRPHYQYIEVSDTVDVYKNPKESELGFDIIAINDEVTVSVTADQERPLTVNASGEITIYNNFSTEPQRLIPETRFASAGGKIFILGNQEVIIPGKVGEDPGEATAMVYAEKAGSQYNIDSTDFTIPGFKEAGLIDKYNGVYAVSREKFSGGLIGSEVYISDAEREKAELDLNQLLRKRLHDRLNNEKTENVVLIENSQQFRFKESEYISDNTGSVGVLSKRGTVLALVIGNDVLEQYISENYIQISEEETIELFRGTDIEITLKDPLFDFDNSFRTQIFIKGTPLYVWKVNTDLVKKTLSNVKTSELPLYIDEMSSIDRASIKVRPFWRKITSKDINNIKINIQ